MFTYTSRRNLAGKLTGDSSAENLAILDTLLNEADREVITAKPWPFLQRSRTQGTDTSNIHYLPADCVKVLNITVTSGSTKYTPKRVQTREEWDRLTQSTNTTSDTPEAYFVFGKTFSFYPAPSTSTAGAVTLNYKRGQRDLTIADYTTQGIFTASYLPPADSPDFTPTSVTTSSQIVGLTTTWTTSMAGRYLRINESNTNNKGDGQWYEIASVESATELTLVTPYQGTSISGGNASYTIGQVSIIPEEFQMVPMYRAIENYFTYIQPETERATQAKNNYLEGMRRMNAECGSNSIL